MYADIEIMQGLHAHCAQAMIARMRALHAKWLHGCSGLYVRQMEAAHADSSTLCSYSRLHDHDRMSADSSLLQESAVSTGNCLLLGWASQHDLVRLYDVRQSLRRLCCPVSCGPFSQVASSFVVSAIYLVGLWRIPLQPPSLYGRQLLNFVNDRLLLGGVCHVLDLVGLRDVQPALHGGPRLYARHPGLQVRQAVHGDACVYIRHHSLLLQGLSQTAAQHASLER